VTWEGEGHAYSYDQLTHEAEGAEPFRSLIDPDDPVFLAPGDMPTRIRDFCRCTHQPEPETVGQMMRAIFESLALKYRGVLECLVDLAGKRVDTLHIIGGGARNTLLCQMTANSVGREVIAGPFEATALGNGIVQLITLGVLDDLAEARRILSRTQDTARYEPRESSAWEDAYQRFCALVQSR
jgi:sugar (pentulose or hexulose) kinase